MPGHWQAFLIAAASSTDNFMVGVSLGLSSISNSVSMHWLIWGIAFCNASTALAAAMFGEQISAVVPPWLQNCVAGSVFFWIGWSEVDGQTDHENANVSDSNASQAALFIQLAVPMSLNNLAGGVASGMAGVSVAVAAAYALLVSAAFMEIGVILGRFGRQNNRKRREQLQKRANIWGCAIYVVLGIQSFYSAVA